MKSGILKNLKTELKKINKEYLLLFFIISIVIFLSYQSSQGLSQIINRRAISMTTYYPGAFAWFAEVTAPVFYDLDAPPPPITPAFFADPDGTSRLGDLFLTGNLKLRGRIRGIAFPYQIDLNDGGGMYVHSIRCDGRITMGANSPGGNANLPRGKHIYEKDYDIAEGVPVSGEYEAADIVSINLDKEYSLKRTEKSFDVNIAGVISEDPKLYMGPGEGKVPLALAGIVKCKVSTENGAIKRGDLLVSASLPGHAMRANPSKIKPGMLIGKALQPLIKGTGKILILVNKQ